MITQLNTISPATEHDNKELFDLSIACPMKGEISAYIDRSPDFLKLYKALDDKYKLLIERKHSRISACFGSVHRKLFINNQPFDVAFWGDLKISPEFRKSISAARLIQEMIRSEQNSGIKIAIASILKGNKESLVFTQGRADIPKAQLLGNYILFNIVPLFKLKTDNEFKVSEAKQIDIPEMVRFYNEYYKNFNFSPKFTVESFSKILVELPDLSIDKFKIARKNNEIKAIIACWDQKKIQKYIILNYSFSVHLLRTLLYIVSLFRRIPSMPKKDEPLKFIYVCFVAFQRDDISALRAILRSVNNEISGTEYSHFAICFNEKDNMSTALKGMVFNKIMSHLYAYSLEGNIAFGDRRLNEKPIHVEYALLI
jgi:hypothetical protein